MKYPAALRTETLIADNWQLFSFAVRGAAGCFIQGRLIAVIGSDKRESFL